jgi:hypothetical protein
MMSDEMTEIKRAAEWFENRAKTTPMPGARRMFELAAEALREKANGVTAQEWISVDERLPEENEYVMIWCGKCQIARIEKGISEEKRKAMKRGELDDPCETGWTLSSGYFTLKRSQSYKACDEQGNNRVPYCWYANGGPMQWFGQDVTHWAYLPKPPKMKGGK